MDTSKAASPPSLTTLGSNDQWLAEAGCWVAYLSLWPTDSEAILLSTHAAWRQASINARYHNQCHLKISSLICGFEQMYKVWQCSSFDHCLCVLSLVGSDDAVQNHGGFDLYTQSADNGARLHVRGHVTGQSSPQAASGADSKQR